MKNTVLEFHQFAQLPAPRNLGPSLVFHMHWKAWVATGFTLILCLLGVIKSLKPDGMIDQFRLDLFPTMVTKGRIWRSWEVEKPDFIETEGVLRGYSYVYLIDGDADNDGYCFAYGKPHEVGDRVEVEYLKSDPAVSVIHGNYYLYPFFLYLRYGLIMSGFLLLFVIYYEIKRRRFVRFLEIAPTAKGTIKSVNRTGWKERMVETAFSYLEAEHTALVTVKGSTEQPIREIEQTFGSVTVAVRARKPKKSVVIEFLGL